MAGNLLSDDDVMGGPKGPPNLLSDEDVMKPAKVAPASEEESPRKASARSAALGAAGPIALAAKAAEAAGIDMPDPIKTIKNIPASAGRVAEGLYHAVRHPIDTATGVGKLAEALLSHVEDPELRGAINRASPEVQKAYNDAVEAQKERTKPVLEAALKGIEERYGSLAALKNTIETDPVGAALDASMVVPVASPISAGGRLASGVTRGVVEPAISHALAFKAGVGADDIRLAARAGMLGGEENAAFRGQMTRTAPMDVPVELAERGAAKEAQQAREAYLANKENWNEANKYLDIAPVEGAVEKGRGMTRFDGLAYNLEGDKALDAIAARIAEWKNKAVPENVPKAVEPAPPLRAGESRSSLISSPETSIYTREGAPAGPLPEDAYVRRAAIDEPGTITTIPERRPTNEAILDQLVNEREATHAPRFTGPAPDTGVMGPHPSSAYTIEGFDKLKQAVGELVFTRNIAPEGTAARAAAMTVYNAIKDEIGKQAPNYAKAMGDAQEAIEQLKEIRKGLSVNERASMDTTLSKLQSAMRSDVAGRFGARKQLVDVLAQHEPTLPYALAGQSMSSIAPRGMTARLMAGGELVGHGLTAGTTLPALALSSPRLVGEAANAAGRMGGIINSAWQAAGEILKNSAGPAAELGKIDQQLNAPR